MAEYFKKIAMNDNNIKYSTMNEFDNINVIEAVDKPYKKYIIGSTHNTYGKFKSEKSKYRLTTGSIKPDENSFIFYDEYTSDNSLITKMIHVFLSPDKEFINKIICYGNVGDCGTRFETEIKFGDDFQIKITNDKDLRFLYNKNELKIEPGYLVFKININQLNLIEKPALGNIPQALTEFNIIKTYFRMLKDKEYYDYLQNINNLQLSQNAPQNDINEKRKCIYCIEKIANHIMEKCHHLVYCENCNIETEHMCPICRVEGKTHIIFM